MLRMADACQDGMGANGMNANTAKSQRFQEMYVQRHNNVRLVFMSRCYDIFFKKKGLTVLVTIVLLPLTISHLNHDY